MQNILLNVAITAIAMGWLPAYAQTIDSIEINQAIGKLYDGTANTNFVAGKVTVVRAFMSADVMVDANTTSAVVTRDGQNVTTLQPKNYPMPTRVVDFLCPRLDACGRWAAGSYTFQLTVNGGAPKSTAGITYNFQARQKLRILARPVRATFSGTVVSVPNDDWKASWMYVRATYPIADDAITWDARDEFDATNIPNVTIDVDTDDGRKGLWDALNNLQPATCRTDPTGQGCYDLIVGFIGQNPKSANGGMLAGYTYTGPGDLSSIAVAVATDPDFAATVAHEIAHTRLLGDTYANGSINCTLNPSPDGVMGSDFNTRQATTCNAGRKPASNIDRQGNNIDGTLVPQTVNPYDVAGPGPLPDKADFMASGNGSASTSFWITPDSYTRLFTQLVPTPPAAAQAVANLASVAAVQFSGSITQAGVVTLNPWKELLAQVPSKTGTYSIRAVDGNGATLATQGFNVSFFVLTNPPTTVTTAPFNGIAAFPANTAKFQVLQGATVLKEVLVSHTDPVVSQVTPAASGQTISGKFTILWSASDPDGNALTFNVEYTRDITRANPVWDLIGQNLTTTSYTYDFSGLPGGQHAVLRVTASDGVRSGSAMSAQFSVPFKGPEVFIDNDNNSNFEVEDEIELSGAAVDLQDGVIPDAGLVWTSNISGKLATGGDIVINLPAGQHTITLTATNSAGMTSSSSVVIRVGSLDVAFDETPGVHAIVATANFGGLIASATLPKGALTKPAAVIIEVTAGPANKTPPTGLAFAGRFFDLEVEQETAPDVFTPVTSIPQGVTITLGYNAPFDGNSLKLFRWSTGSSSWVDAATECQPASTYNRPTNLIVLNVCRTGSFALAGTMLAQGIVLPPNVTLGPGQIALFPVSLLAPAGPSGAFITLSTSDTSKVLLPQGSNSIAVFIPAGATIAPRPSLYITGVNFGTATITATSFGLQSSSQMVQVGAMLAFFPASATLNGTAFEKRLTLTLSAPAPAGGLTINLRSDNPSVARVPATVTILQNTTDVTVPVTGFGVGSTMIHASALPNVPETRVLITVLGQ